MSNLDRTTTAVAYYSPVLAIMPPKPLTVSYAQYQTRNRYIYTSIEYCSGRLAQILRYANTAGCNAYVQDAVKGKRAIRKTG